MSPNEGVTDAAVREALAWFIDRFIAPDRRPRWRHFVLAEPRKGGAELHKFERDAVVSRLTAQARWPIETSRTEQDLQAAGAFFAGEAVESLDLREALARLTPVQHDAIFVAVDRSFAVFFHHEGQVWTSR